jgi:GDP-L-fucose synthase
VKVVLTGSAGLLGSSIVRAWHTVRPEDELVALTRADVDLSDAAATAAVVAGIAPDAVIHAAAHVAGIEDKLRSPDDFLAMNLRLDDSVFSAAVAAEVPEFLYVSSAAVYPADVAQPIPESALLGGPLEPANEGYGLAKIVGTRRCSYLSRQHGWAYRAVLPSNLYGPGDDFRPGRAHLVSSAIAKAHAAAVAGADVVDVWGDGTARREFTYAPDLAGWLVTQVGALASWPELLNAGSGMEATVREYYEHAATAAGFTGRLVFDPERPSGVARRLLDSTAARALGWSPTTSWEEGFAACHTDLLTSKRAAT